MDLGVRIFSSAAAVSPTWLRIARLTARMALGMENRNLTATVLDKHEGNSEKALKMPPRSCAGPTFMRRTAAY
jgi:hypothetical protein